MGLPTKRDNTTVKATRVVVPARDAIGYSFEVLRHDCKCCDKYNQATVLECREEIKKQEQKSDVSYLFHVDFSSRIRFHGIF